MMIVNNVPELIAAKFGGEENVNLKDVERATGLTYATVYAWMNRRISRIDFPTLEKWCKYLDCGVGDLLVYVPESSGK